MSLQEKLTELATELDVPGAVAGIVLGDETEVAVHGVTNVDHPLPVDEGTLFQFGSTGKTVTATALMVLAEQGRIDLDEPVRSYVPELRLTDQDVAEKVTVLQLLNHTAGWMGDIIHETGDGDDCLEKYVAYMATLAQVTPLGDSVSYNNASLSLAGHVLARVHGTTYEQAVRELVLDPLGLEHTFGFPKDIMTMRFASGHHRGDDGKVGVARPWALPRSGTPAGGWTATVGDQLLWARFHLGGYGEEVLSPKGRARMQEPTAHMPGSALGDAVGISWLLSELDGALLVGHGGTTIGQHSDFLLVPERGFGFVCMTNSGPNGGELHGKLRAWALENVLGLSSEEPELADLTDAQLAEFEGRYVTSAAVVDLTAQQGRLIAKITITDTSLISEGQSPEQPKVPLAIVVGDGDKYVIPEGDAKGMKGYFSRDADGRVDGVNFSGRHMAREMAPKS
ncbi:MAG: Beta-lactamase [Frankiales bacterium]|nr:Beta-lactamase [Frankiales bacterium]